MIPQMKSQSRATLWPSVPLWSPTLTWWKPCAPELLPQSQSRSLKIPFYLFPSCLCDCRLAHIKTLTPEESAWTRQKETVQLRGPQGSEQEGMAGFPSWSVSNNSDPFTLVSCCPYFIESKHKREQFTLGLRGLG